MHNAILLDLIKKARNKHPHVFLSFLFNLSIINGFDHIAKKPNQ